MSYPSRFFASLAVVALASWLLPACGGAFNGGDDDDDGGSAGTGGRAGGTSKGGTGGSGGSAGNAGSAGGGGDSCLWEGTTYQDGESFPAGDGCNTCSCSDGEVGCTLLGCPEEGCILDSVFYPVGESVNDGCNTCYCEAAGQWACTLAECPECTDFQTTYAAAIDEAKTCDPQLPGQCSQLIFYGLQCGCDSFVNPENGDAIAAADAARGDYNALSCGGGVACGACLPPSSSYCSTEGRCVDVYDYGAGASCKVGDVVYPSGSTEVPDPVSCNLCSCTDGQLSCDTADCPEPCPLDTIYGTQCAQCGASDGCEVIEHACLPLCNDNFACQSGVCIYGVCKSLCG